MRNLMHLIRPLAPAPLRAILRAKVLAPLYLKARSGNRFHCPLCQRGFRKFGTVGIVPRPNAQCPNCHSLERHRALWLALQHLTAQRQISFSGRLLHVAPEATLTDMFKGSFDYLSVDLDGARAMIAMDITKMTFADESFDAIVCNHVLEHIPDDRAALCELFRILKPGGWASIQVPMKGEMTDEDLTITDPHERLVRYGQDDHVRQYGLDFAQRLQAAGFEVLPVDLTRLLTSRDVARFAIAGETEVLLVTKG